MPQHRGRSGMPEHVGAMGGAVDMGAKERPGRHRRHGFGAKRAARGNRRQQHRRVRHGGALGLARGEHRLTDVLREGQAGGALTSRSALTISLRLSEAPDAWRSAYFTSRIDEYVDLV